MKESTGRAFKHLRADATTSARGKTSRNQRDQVRERFRVLWHIYSHDSKRRRVEVLPGDLVKSIEVAHEHKKMFQDNPALLVASLRGKEGPWKDGMWSSWKNQGPGVSSSTAPSTAAMLGSTARAMQNADREVWAANVGRSVSHHSGWLPHLQQIGVLKKVPGAHKPKSSIKIGGYAYTVAKVSKRVLSRMDEMADIGSNLHHLKIPRTWSSWKEAVQEANDMKPTKVPSKSYNWPWLVRAHLISSMRSKGIQKLSWCRESLTIEDIGTAFPDQKQHVMHLSESMLVSDLMKDLHYDGPLELLTMYLCFFCSKAMGKYPAEWLVANRQGLIRTREAYYERTGLHPHCALLCKEFAATVPAS